MNKQQIIFDRLQQAFSPSYLEVIDESEQHLGHGGYDKAGSHYAIKIASTTFKGKTRVAIHREIYAICADMMPEQIHALRIIIL